MHICTLAFCKAAFATLLLALTALPHTGTSWAQERWPSKAITIVVPYSAGGSTDIFTRLTAQALSQKLGQPVVIDNRPGAGGNIGAQAVARAPADGYTLLMGTVGTHAINAAIYPKMPFDHVADFAPIGRVAAVPNVLLLSPGLPVGSVAELMAYGKAEPERLTFASSGNGSSVHLAGELFKSMTGTPMRHVPYKGSAPALTDLIAGQTSIMFDNMPSALPFIQSGKLRALAVTTLERAPQLPELPTLHESVLPGFDAYSWFGLFAPANTPAAIVQNLNQALAQAIKEPELRARIIAQGGEPVSESPQEFAAFIAEQTQKWAQVVQDSGARID